LIKDYIELLI